MLDAQIAPVLSHPHPVAVQGAALEDEVFVFYSALRSGSTLLQLMLDGHPQISCPSERDFLLDHLTRQPGGRLVLDRDALSRDRIFRASRLRLPETDDGVAAFWDLVAQDQARTPGQKLVIELHRNLDLLREIFPTARFVRLARDPRDVARSSMKLGWAGTTWHGIDHWIDTERGWEAHAPKADDICALRYETLVSDPKTHLSRICDFVGVAYDAAMLGYTDYTNYDPVDPTLAFQWKRVQSPGEIRDVEYKVGDLLTARGYMPSQRHPVAPSRWRKLMLTVQNKRFVWSRRIRRFGLRDTVLVFLANRTGINNVGRAAQLRIDQKVQQSLK